MCVLSVGLFCVCAFCACPPGALLRADGGWPFLRFLDFHKKSYRAHMLSSSHGSLHRVYNCWVLTKDFYLTVSTLHCLLNFSPKPLRCSVVHPFLKVVSILSVDPEGPSETYIPCLFRVDFPPFSLSPPPGFLHPVTLGCLILCFHWRVPQRSRVMTFFSVFAVVISPNVGV